MGEGRFKTRPTAPSSVCSSISTTDRSKLGSSRRGLATSNWPRVVARPIVSPLLGCFAAPEGGQQVGQALQLLLGRLDLGHAPVRFGVELLGSGFGLLDLAG